MRTGIPTAFLDFRKECRRNQIGDHCTPFRPTKVLTYELATSIELQLFDLFGIKIHHTFTFSCEVFKHEVSFLEADVTGPVTNF